MIRTLVILTLTIQPVSLHGEPAVTTSKKTVVAQCKRLEALGRWAQSKLSKGYEPTEAQRRAAAAHLEWYERNCRS